MVGSMIRDLGQPKLFHARWPRVNTDVWPGRPAFQAWSHPGWVVFLFFVVLAAANILLGLFGVLVVG